MDVWQFGFMALWMHGSLDSWHYGCMAVWIHGTIDSWQFGFMAQWMHGSLDLWHYGCMAVWIHGTMDAWQFGFMALWMHGSLDSWIPWFRWGSIELARVYLYHPPPSRPIYQRWHRMYNSPTTYGLSFFPLATSLNSLCGLIPEQ